MPERKGNRESNPRHRVKDSKSLTSLLSRLVSSTGKRAEVELEILSEGGDWSDGIRALQMVERVRACLSAVGYSFIRENESIAEQKRAMGRYATYLIKWYILYRSGRAELVSKYLSVNLYNICTGQEELPHVELSKEETRLLSFSPSSFKFLTQLRLKCTKKVKSGGEISKGMLQKLQQFLYFKKGCPRISETFKKDGLKKHYKAMTATPGRLIQPQDEGFIVFESALKERAKKIVSMVFKNYRHPRSWWTPSTSASHTSTRRKGGSAKDVFMYTGTEYEYHEVFGSAIGSGAFKEFIKVPTYVNMFVSLKEKINCTPVALSEPLKVRVITKEDTMATYALKGAQMELWKCLKSHPWFALTGRPANVDDIPPLDKGQKWISVDYSAATDNLSAWFIKTVTQYVCDMCDLPFDFCYESLCKHAIHYKKCNCESDCDCPYGEILQNNGSLMGSILSFIILCLCNATIISLVVNPRKFKRGSRFLVNGDDGLFRGDQSRFDLWAKLAAQLGLQPSVGKTYMSNRFCVINSQMFIREHIDGRSSITHLPYGNMSGLTPFDAKSADRLKPLMSLAESHKDWVEGFPNKKKVVMESLWYRTMKDYLCSKELAEKGISWYLPKCFGGLGINPPLSGDGVLQPVTFPQFLRMREKVKSLNNSYSFSCSHKSGLDMNGDLSGFFEQIGITRKLRCEEESSEVSLDQWLDIVGRKASLKPSSLSVLAESALKLVNPVDVLHSRGAYEDPLEKEEIRFIPSQVWKGSKGIRMKYRHVPVVDLIGYQIKDNSKGVTWTPRIPQSEEYPWMDPYRAWLEQLIKARASPKLFVDHMVHSHRLRGERIISHCASHCKVE